MDINYELYKVFYYVATSLSFSEASKKLYISQSAVSQSIKTLEKKLGQTLFIRSTKRVQLTPAGSLLLKHVEPDFPRGESASGFRHTGTWTAAHRSQRHHLPLFPCALPQAVPQDVSECANQGDQRHLHSVCGASGSEKG